MRDFKMLLLSKQAKKVRKKGTKTRSSKALHSKGYARKKTKAYQEQMNESLQLPVKTVSAEEAKENADGKLRICIASFSITSLIKHLLRAIRISFVNNFGFCILR